MQGKGIAPSGINRYRAVKAVSQLVGKKGEKYKSVQEVMP
jgi:hypothetical protein